MQTTPRRCNIVEFLAAVVAQQVIGCLISDKFGLGIPLAES